MPPGGSSLNSFINTLPPQPGIYLMMNDKDKIIKIVPEHYFTRYVFMPGIDGGFYGMGFGSLLVFYPFFQYSFFFIIYFGKKISKYPSTNFYFCHRVSSFLVVFHFLHFFSMLLLVGVDFLYM